MRAPTAISAKTISVINPATGEVIAEVLRDGRAEVAAAFERARRDQPAWAAIGFARRARLLRAFERRLGEDPALPEIIVRETGKPRYEAESYEVNYACMQLRWATGRAARRALAGEVRRGFFFPNKRSRLVYHPRGVIAVIGPFNWPLLNVFGDAIAALAAGNAVVMKPSPLTPLASLRVVELWREAGLPEGVLQAANGDAETGEALVDGADMVFFTGSPASGRAVAERAARRLIPCVLELGGSAPVVVLADADLERAAHGAVWSGFAHSGQVCVRNGRVVVEASVHDALVELMVAELGRLRQGVPQPSAEEDVDLGALHPQQIARADLLVKDAVQKGARLVHGGRQRGDLAGFFYEPALLVGVTPEMEVARSEIFAPVVAVQRAADEEDAVRLANLGAGGLAASVYSRDARRAAAVARRIEAGSVCVNDVLVGYFALEAPLGGVKGSGLGVRHGVEGLRQFCRLEVVVEDAPLAAGLSRRIARAISFPYTARALRGLRALRRART